MNKTSLATGIVVAALAPMLSACGGNCSQNETCASGGGGSSTTTTTGAGGSVVTPPKCVPNMDPMTAVDSTCGVFVSATGDDSAPGTKGKPVRTLGQAATLAMAGKKTIYACAEELAGVVTLPAGLAVYGGLDCMQMPRSWKYVGDTKPTIITADADMIPLTLASGTGTKLFDLHVLAKAAMKAGGSSIAMVADQVTAEIARCSIEAGDAKAGTSGEGYMTSAQSGAKGESGGNACSAAPVNGGNPVSSICGMPDSSSGLGGSGTPVSGGAGSPGLPDGATNGGAGEGKSKCINGMDGNDGALGTSGAGANSFDSLDNGGFVGGSGLAGAPGLVAQGGGGGGGSKGGDSCPTDGSRGGAAGGSGGSGGCGGLGGLGGTAGGSSVALISLGSTLTFTSTTLRTGAGGNGGDGGPGQLGGNGGDPGPGGSNAGYTTLNKGCPGGPGGKGGNGGQGGGGLGGHSIGIAFVGTAPPTDGWTAMTGTPGLGGTGGNVAGHGAPGVNASSQMFAP